MLRANTNNRLVVFGFFDTYRDVIFAAEALKQEFISSVDMSVRLTDEFHPNAHVHASPTQITEGTIFGASSGVILGGILGGLVGIGLVIIPGVDQLTIIGSIVSFVVGAALGGMLGALMGALVGIGVPKHERPYFFDNFKTQKIVLSVFADTAEEVNAIKSCLEKAGAHNVSLTDPEVTQFY